MIRILIILSLIAQPVSALSLSISQDSVYQKESLANHSLSNQKFAICKLHFDRNSDNESGHCNVCDLFADDNDLIINNVADNVSTKMIYTIAQKLKPPYSKFLSLVSTRSPPSKLL